MDGMKSARSALVLTAGLTVGIGTAASCRSETPSVAEAAPATTGLARADFHRDAVKTLMAKEPCRLSGGTVTTCYRLVVSGTPSDHEPGPFCPRTVDDTKETVGVWLDGSGVVYDADGDFIRGLDDLYGGKYGEGAWQLFDATTGAINVTETKEACEAAARPDVEEAYQNHCVECDAADFTHLEELTFLIPVEPVPAATVNDVRSAAKIGVALNGVELDPPAPVHAILGARTIAAFDDCGGHVNPHGGYHYHAAMDCSHRIAQADGHASKIGYALDGYAIYAELDAKGAAANGLDACRGHADETRGYHYHAASPGENTFLGCFRGELGLVEGVHVRPRRPPSGPPGAPPHRPQRGGPK